MTFGVPVKILPNINQEHYRYANPLTEIQCNLYGTYKIQDAPVIN
jgi:hypothetical protein